MIFLYPFYFLVISTFKTFREITINPTAFPTSLYLGNYVEIFEKTPVLQAFRNTLFLTVCSVLLIVIVGERAAYPIAFNPNKFNNANPEKAIDWRNSVDVRRTSADIVAMTSTNSASVRASPPSSPILSR